MTSELGAAIVRAGQAPQKEMLWSRGIKHRLAGAENSGAFDFHINEIIVGSGPGPYHYHEQAESSYYVLDGEIEAVVEGVRHILHVGDSAYFPPRLLHSLGNAGREPARVVEVYAPAGYDFHVVPDPVDVVDADPSPSPVRP
jgi:mannose-6-phosphate isomerase-like protein (cupin superfamily)